MIKFVFWRFETSLIYTVLGSAATGILVTLFLWVPRAIKSSIRLRELKKRVESVETVSNGWTRRIDQENKLR